jgi:predicted ester cyclase
MAMSAENIAVVRRWFDEVWNHRREATMHELMEPGAVCFADTGELRGPDGFKSQQYDPLVTAFPDATIKIERIIGHDDDVAVHWSADGTHTGTALGLAPTGRRVRFTGMSWIKLRDGKLWVGWQWSDIPAVLASLRS